MPWMPAAALAALHAEIANLWKALETANHAVRLEQVRANAAVDELLALRGLPPVTPQEEPTVSVTDALAETEQEKAEMEALMRDRGFGAVAKGGR